LRAPSDSTLTFIRGSRPKNSQNFSTVPQPGATPATCPPAPATSPPGGDPGLGFPAASSCQAAVSPLPALPRRARGRPPKTERPHPPQAGDTRSIIMSLGTRRRFAGAARPLTPAARSQEPAPIRGQGGGLSMPAARPPDRPHTNQAGCGPGPMQVSRPRHLTLARKGRRHVTNRDCSTGTRCG
jgi:hypothetical protein